MDDRQRTKKAPRKRARAAESVATNGAAKRLTAAFPVAGIGASAGGLEAIEKLLGQLQPDGTAYVVLQHLPPGRESALTEILTRATRLPVSILREGMVLQRDRVHVVPPNADVRLEGLKVHLTIPQDLSVPRHGIDSFFRSLAAELGRLSIGVVLSGAGSDGTLGLRAIKDQGGITFVQDPGTAGTTSMPQSALDAGVADFCLSPESIGDELVRISGHPYVAHGGEALDEHELAKVFLLLRESFGVDFSTYKRPTLDRRIQRRMALHRMSSLRDYGALLGSMPAELSILYADLLVGVTSFFRDPDVFELLKNAIFPRMMEERGADQAIRIWVPGCASGEEAYSIAIVLLEFLGDAAGDHAIQIFATDIDDVALERARHAFYPASIEADVSPERLARFFKAEKEGYRVVRRVRDLVVFARHNLGRDPPFGRLDLVSCRNLLIYIQPALQKRILRILHYALRPGGFLVLGLSETIGEAIDLYEAVDRKHKIFQRNMLAAPLLETEFAPRLPAGAREPVQGLRSTQSLQQLADRRLLERYVPPGMLVNEKLEVLQFHGRTGTFLEPAAGAASTNVLKLVRPDLTAPVHAVITESAATGRPASSKILRVGDGPAGLTVIVEALPILDVPGAQRCFHLVFKEVAPPDAAAAAVEAGPDPRRAALERELVATKESLQATIEALETANEELQSTNEELQSANEELQSTNEELETSKEEIQSTNEELTTVNDELQSRMAQLGAARDDLKNVLAGSSTALLIVDSDLRIRGFSAAAERLFSLIPTDVGRPVAYIRTVMMVQDLEGIIATVISSLAAKEVRVRGVDGNWYTMRILPYQTSESVIHGCLIELTRAPSAERARAPGEIGELATEVLAALPQALMLVDDRLRLVWANRQFFETFQFDADVFGRPLEELWHGRTNAELWSRLESTLAGGAPFSDLRIERPFAADEDRTTVFSARRLETVDKQTVLMLVSLKSAEGGGGA
ncbi:MAG: CheR family methyltransferase [Myxococcales bacterium]